MTDRRPLFSDSASRQASSSLMGEERPVTDGPNNRVHTVQPSASPTPNETDAHDAPVIMTPLLWAMGLLAVAIGVGVGFVFSAASLFK